MKRFREHFRQLKERQQQNLSMFMAIIFAFVVLLLLAFGIYFFDTCGRF